MTTITQANPLEHHISRAEIFYSQDRTAFALKEAKLALEQGPTSEQAISIKTFIAKCYSKLGRIEESNKIYRELLAEEVYLPPVILGLLHNNLAHGKYEKVKKNIHLVKLFDLD